MSGAYVFIDRSQFPENVRRELIDSLRTRAINHKFHYDSYKQASKWLELHEAYSPARIDESCRRIYDNAYRAVLRNLRRNRINIVGLACGGGKKEARLLQLIVERGLECDYIASDVSLPLVLTAQATALPFLCESRCHLVVCDLATTESLAKNIDAVPASSDRIVTLFGILPNFEPTALFPPIADLLRANDWLLVSANLASGIDYGAGVQAVLPQYDNAPTRDWLMTLLLDLGFEREDGEVSFAIEIDARELRRIVAHFELKRPREIRIADERICFYGGERIRLFFSYRHTTRTISSIMAAHDLQIFDEWVNDSAEEGVYLCRKTR